VSAARTVWIRRLGLAAVIALAMGYVPYHLYSSSGLSRYLGLKRERDTLRENNLELYDANRRLRAELDAIVEPGTDKLSNTAIERAARDELGLVKPGEVVFELGSGSN
jgi:cell division protein FtsB